MLAFLLKCVVKSPIYPHWLEFNKLEAWNDFILKWLWGRVLEVGWWMGAKASKIKHSFRDSIQEYILTDYSSWDGEFSEKSNRSKRFGNLGEIFFSFSQDRVPLDVVCSATELPFADETFDNHLSFETLEHIWEPEKYFSEAVRVLKKGGYIRFCVPFLSRMHGGEPEHREDFFRYLFWYYHEVAERYNLEIIHIYSNTGIWTTVASLMNQYLVRVILESRLLTKIISLAIAPIVFFFTNTLWFLLDLRPDCRFATRYHVVFKKK